MKLDIIKKIEKIIGKKNIVQSENDKKKYLTEWRNRYTGEAKAILKPKNVQEVSSLMKIFNKEKMVSNLIILLLPWRGSKCIYYYY